MSMSAILLGVVTVQLIVLFITLIGLYTKNTNAICKSRKRLDGKTVIVTGGTAGMGLELATDFAARGARVIIACPYVGEGENARTAIVHNTGNENVVFIPLDLGSLESVRIFAAEVLKTEDRLDILLNNAGIGIPGDFLTADGMNLIMQVNYFGHFLLTLLLLPLLRKTGHPSEQSRIINTSSVLHRFGTIDIENMYKTGYWYRVKNYCDSKFCLILFSLELTKRLAGSSIAVNSLDPGCVGTGIFIQDGPWGHILTFLCRYMAKTPWEGAQTALHIALDQKAGQMSGEFFKDCKLTRAKPEAYDDKNATRIWEESVRLVKLNDAELEKCFKVL